MINDSLGHSVGDELLRGVAERLQGCVREEDTVARLGGDEFILLVTGISSLDDAATVAQKIVEANRAPFRLDDRKLFITTSVGVAIYPADGLDAESLVCNADAAMYRQGAGARPISALHAGHAPGVDGNGEAWRTGSETRSRRTPWRRTAA